MTETHFRYADIRGHRLFYREAGPADAPVLLLLHGYPTSSFMFRNLIPRLADRWRVIAPDMLGFGHSDAPADFTYTFDSLTDLTAELLDRIGVSDYAMYVQDWGAPIGWRLALRTPAAITAVITQNGNAYDEGLQPAFFDGIEAFWKEQTPETEAGVREALTYDFTRWQYLEGVPDESLVDPDTWEHDYTLLARPGIDEIMVPLFLDYGTNPPLYPSVHRYFREHRPPLLAVWGRNDPVFGPDGALAFTRDLPDAEVHLLDGGHFLLESALDPTVALIREFLATHLPH